MTDKLEHVLIYDDDDAPMTLLECMVFWGMLAFLLGTCVWSCID